MDRVDLSSPKNGSFSAALSSRLHEKWHEEHFDRPDIAWRSRTARRRRAHAGYLLTVIVRVRPDVRRGLPFFGEPDHVRRRRVARRSARSAFQRRGGIAPAASATRY
jgi:hypothetical protein